MAWAELIAGVANMRPCNFTTSTQGRWYRSYENLHHPLPSTARQSFGDSFALFPARIIHVHMSFLPLQIVQGAEVRT